MRRCSRCCRARHRHRGRRARLEPGSHSKRRLQREPAVGEEPDVVVAEEAEDPQRVDRPRVAQVAADGDHRIPPDAPPAVHPGEPRPSTQSLARRLVGQQPGAVTPRRVSSNVHIGPTTGTAHLGTCSSGGPRAPSLQPDTDKRSLWRIGGVLRVLGSKRADPTIEPASPPGNDPPGHLRPGYP